MRDFLGWLWEGAEGLYGEIRVIMRDGKVDQVFFPIPYDDEIIASMMADDAIGRDVYIGVVPRIRYGGKAEDVSGATQIIWADVDAKHHGDSKQLALAAILDFPVPPSVIVDSGHGFHCYWKLDHLIGWDQAIDIMKGIAKRIGGDAVYDRARILRLPGTHNHKDGDKVPVRLIRFDTTLRYSATDFDEFRYVEPTRDWWAGSTWNVNTYTFTGPIDEIDLDFDPGKGARSEHDYGVVCWMIEHGWEDYQIVAAFQEHPTGIGAKTAKAGERYLQRTIAKARRNCR